MRRLRIFFRRRLRKFFSKDISLRWEVLRVCITFMILFVCAAFLFPFTDAGTRQYGLVHGVLRILFEDDLDSIKNLVGPLYAFGFFLKMAATYTIPFFGALVLAKFMGIRLFKMGARHLKDHIIIYGFMANFYTFARELVDSGKTDLVLISHLEELPFEIIEAEFILIKASSNLDTDLLQANIQQASQLIVVPNPGESPEEFKERAMLVTLSARNWNKGIHITFDAFFGSHAESFHTTDVNEIVPTNTLISSLEAMMIINPSIHPFLAEITSSSQGNSFSIEKLPDEMEGFSFLDALLSLKEEKNWLLLAVKRGNNIITNPRKLTLKKEDEIYVLKESKI